MNQRVLSLSEAAVLADEFVVMYKSVIFLSVENMKTRSPKLKDEHDI